MTLHLGFHRNLLTARPGESVGGRHEQTTCVWKDNGRGLSRRRDGFVPQANTR